ncbi:MAG TPA: hypothetical protein VKV03_09135 [Candidatus Binataceae bacterium]|nr:hypothetical protein [Candidatus Binataceae bacterium]
MYRTIVDVSISIRKMIWRKVNRRKLDGSGFAAFGGSHADYDEAAKLRLQCDEKSCRCLTSV